MHKSPKTSAPTARFLAAGRRFKRAAPIAIQLEERDLLDVHPEYAGYRKRVPMLIPRFKRAGGAGTPAAEAA